MRRIWLLEVSVAWAGPYHDGLSVVALETSYYYHGPARGQTRHEL